jgi:carbon-monoxide dehydrogenase medium subunit
MPYIGHFQIRTRGTLGGSIVHADPAAELPAVSLALQAEFVLRSAARQRVTKAADFFRTYLTTAIEPTEILTEIRLPPWKPQWRWGFREVSRRQGDFALVGAVAILDMNDGGICRTARLTMFGIGGTPVRLPKAEAILSGEEIDGRRLDAVAHVVAGELEPDADIHASAEYRKEVGGVVARRALKAAGGIAEDGRI